MGTLRLAPGETIGGKWLLRRRIGRGGMGEVWIAVHKSLEQEVALKALDKDAFPLDLLEEARSRFHLEAQLAADLSRRTRHIASVIDHGDDDGLDYLVMELLRGDSLEDLLQRDGRIEPERLVEIVRQAARGLVIAHESGVIHRDLKPANIFVTVDDDGATLVKLLDFGIAKARPRKRDSAPPSTHRTRAGVLLGTAAYMSPEQARGLEIDTRVDLWALAALTYELLTGQLPFNGTSDVDLLMNICTAVPPAPSALVPGLPAAVDEVFLRAFAREVDDRFPDARSFAEALVAGLRSEGPEPPLPLVVPASGSDSIVNATYVATPPPMQALSDARPGRRGLWIGLSLAAVAALLLLVFLGARTPRPKAAAASASPPPRVEPTAVASPAPPAAVAPPAQAVVETAATSAKVAAPSKPAPRAKPAPAATAAPKKVDKGEIF